jgi:hypothetical protein
VGMNEELTITKGWRGERKKSNRSGLTKMDFKTNKRKNKRSNLNNKSDKCQILFTRKEKEINRS